MNEKDKEPGVSYVMLNHDTQGLTSFKIVINVTDQYHDTRSSFVYCPTIYRSRITNQKQKISLEKNKPKERNTKWKLVRKQREMLFNFYIVWM